MNTKKGQASFECEIAALQKQLGISPDYARQHQLTLQPECPEPVSIGRDIFGREQKMSQLAASAWIDMQATATASGIELLVVSAFRPVDYQARIIRRKLAAGQRIEEILQVSAAPGYSEHHGGAALDLTTPGFEPLEEAFDQSSAFEWLTGSAARFRFSLSYPKGNPHGLAYEPWHWCWHPGLTNAVQRN